MNSDLNSYQESSELEQKDRGYLSLFIPSKGFFVTPILIDINIAIFILMVINGANIMTPSTELLLKWGANLREITLAGEWWRLISCCFIHIGILHLFMNLYALLYIGLLLEPLLGRTKFAIAYLLTGIAASMASIWWNDNIVSAGASGAIFGMYGVFLAMLTTNLIKKSERRPLLTSIGVFVVFNLMNGMKAGIDNAAHIGGLISGLLAGYLFISSLKKPEEKGLHTRSITIITAIILSVVYYAFTHTPNPLGKYNAILDEFSINEEKSLRFYHLEMNANKEQRIAFLNDTAIVAWNKNIALLNTIDEKVLPDNLQVRDKLIKKYAELRLNSFELQYKILTEDPSLYVAKADSINREMEKTLNLLNDGTAQ